MTIRSFFPLALLVLTIVVGLSAGRVVAADAAADKELDQRIDRLIVELGDPQFAVRQRAQRELTRLGQSAFDALSAAENSEDVEISTQARYLVRLIRIDWVQEGDSAEARPIMANYEGRPEQDRLTAMKNLADLPGDAGLAPLCRLARFEASPVMSKQAAVSILKQPLLADADWPARRKTILTNLDRSRRPAADWLRTYVQSHDDPKAALAAWQELTTAEKDQLEEHPQESQNQLVQELLRQQVGLLDRLQRGDEAKAVVQRIVELERGDPQTLKSLVEWLAKRNAWNMVDEVAARFSASFEADADLLYALAQARLAQEDPTIAEATAEKAFKINPNPENLREHLAVAIQLQRRGLTRWSDREFRFVIAQGLAPAVAELGLFARNWFSNVLHDRQEDLEAAKLLEQMLAATDTDNRIGRHLKTTTPDELRARMNFYFGEDARREHKDEKALEYFEKALTQNPGDADVLIALYHVKLAPDRRQKLLREIKETVDGSRQRIEQQPDDATECNQLAWLVANTEGDLDEAVRLSKHSIELRHEGGYLDTLAHCYYAQHDYARAVETQTEAAKLEPHSQAIARQLKVFREALAKQQAEEKKPGDKPADADAKKPAESKPAEGKPAADDKPTGDKQP